MAARDQLDASQLFVKRLLLCRVVPASVQRLQFAKKALERMLAEQHGSERPTGCFTKANSCIFGVHKKGHLVFSQSCVVRQWRLLEAHAAILGIVSEITWLSNSLRPFSRRLCSDSSCTCSGFLPTLARDSVMLAPVEST